MALVFKVPKLLGFAAQEAVTGARTMLRLVERATFATVMAGGAAGAAAGASASSSPAAATVAVEVRGASAGFASGARPEWDGPSFGASATRAALPPPSGPSGARASRPRSQERCAQLRFPLPLAHRCVPASDDPDGRARCFGAEAPDDEGEVVNDGVAAKGRVVGVELHEAGQA